VQHPVAELFGSTFDIALETGVEGLTQNAPPNKGSTDVGDVSFRVPTGSLGTVCRVHKSPGHSWQNVAIIGHSIGEKGILYAAKALAATALDLFENSEARAAARAI